MMPKYIAPTYSAEQMRDCRRRVSARDERIAELERTLAVVTAQRDQCREALRSAALSMDNVAGLLLGETDENVANAEHLTACAMSARAALRACDEKRSEASIAAEGGAE